MHKSLLFVLAVGGGGAALAQADQPVVPESGAVPEMTSARTRMELRSVLSAERRADSPLPALQAAPAGRQLSQQERAEMREQLRRYQPPPAAMRPQRP